MRMLKYGLSAILLLGVSEPAHAHGEQVVFVLASHLFVLLGMAVFLIFYRAPGAPKRISFLVLFFFVIIMWAVPGPVGLLYFLISENFLLGVLASFALPAFIGFAALVIAVRVHNRAAPPSQPTQNQRS